MANSKQGTVAWVDLTVTNAEEIRDFYKSVIGWGAEAVGVEDHSDYNMLDANGVPRAGVCHKLGINANIPSQWLVYFIVPDIDAALAAVASRGGSVIVSARGNPGSRVAVIQDPAGAVCALYEQYD